MKTQPGPPTGLPSPDSSSASAPSARCASRRTRGATKCPATAAARGSNGRPQSRRSGQKQPHLPQTGSSSAAAGLLPPTVGQRSPPFLPMRPAAAVAALVLGLLPIQMLQPRAGSAHRMRAALASQLQVGSAQRE